MPKLVRREVEGRGRAGRGLCRCAVLADLARAGVTRDLLIVLGDQLDADAEALRALDPSRDAVVMVEAREEAT